MSLTYEYDADLAFLGELTSEQLDPLVRMLTRGKDGDLRFMEQLTLEPLYKLHEPDHRKYWKLIQAEYQDFGSHTLGSKKSYREILCNVCAKQNIKINESADIDYIEDSLLRSSFERSLEKMTKEELEKIAKELGVKTQGLNKQATVAALQAAIRFGGFKTYQIAVIILHAIASSLGIVLPFVVYTTLTRVMSIIAGPIGLALNALWAVWTIGGPAYRVITRATLLVASLRLIHRERLKHEAKVRRKLNALDELVKYLEENLEDHINLHDHLNLSTVIRALQGLNGLEGMPDEGVRLIRAAVKKVVALEGGKSELVGKSSDAVGELQALDKALKGGQLEGVDELNDAMKALKGSEKALKVLEGGMLERVEKLNDAKKALGALEGWQPEWAEQPEWMELLKGRTDEALGATSCLYDVKDGLSYVKDGRKALKALNKTLKGVQPGPKRKERLTRKHSADGTWKTTMQTPMGAQQGTLELKTTGGALTGKLSGSQGEIEIKEGTVDGNSLAWKADITTPMAMTLEFTATVEGDEINGNVKLGPFGNASLTGTRA